MVLDTSKYLLKYLPSPHSATEGANSIVTGALRVMRTELFRKERGDRLRVKNVVVVLTDGSATIEAAGLEREARLVRYTGAEIFGEKT